MDGKHVYSANEETRRQVLGVTRATPKRQLLSEHACLRRMTSHDPHAAVFQTFSTHGWQVLPLQALSYSYTFVIHFYPVPVLIPSVVTSRHYCQHIAEVDVQAPSAHQPWLCATQSQNTAVQSGLHPATQISSTSNFILQCGRFQVFRRSHSERLYFSDKNLLLN